MDNDSAKYKIIICLYFVNCICILVSKTYYSTEILHLIDNLW